MARTGTFSVLLETREKGHLVGCPLHPHCSFARAGPAPFPAASVTHHGDTNKDSRSIAAHAAQSNGPEFPKEKQTR